MKKTKCSRTLMSPVRVFGVRGEGTKAKTRLLYVVYPSLKRYEMACRKCRYLVTKKDRKLCRIGDPDFLIKFYGASTKLRGRLFVGSVPLAIKSRKPSLYGEIVTFVRNHRARSFRTRVSSLTVRKDGRYKPELADGRDVLLRSPKSKRDRSDGVVSR